MSIKPWKILESSYFRPRFRLDKVELSDGKLLNATVLELSSWANVLAITKDQQAVLIKQYRHGVQEVLWEIPGGVVEEGEDPSEGVRRELLEETGYTATEFIEVGQIYPNPAFQTNMMHCFIAFGAEKVAVQNLDGAEEIDVHLVPLDELIPMIQRGEFIHALQVAVVLRAFVHLGRIR